MTKYGETHQFSARDFVVRLEEYTGRPVDGVIYNQTPPSEEISQSYLAQKAEFVVLDPRDDFWFQRKVYGADLLETDGTIVRHSSAKLASLLQTLFFGATP
jgi:hypothetical protein